MLEKETELICHIYVYSGLDKIMKDLVIFILMKKEILKQLKVIEAEENIKILYACESGSRAWGFPSQDSDYDVRFIYLRDIKWYLRVDYEYQRDVVERPIDDLLDINGWDLKKALLLMRKSNPSLIEWLNSPIVYCCDEEFTAGMKKLTLEYYSPRACFYHYSHMASGNNREYLQNDMVKTKKYFYVLRPILAMLWIEQDLGVVPMEFETLVKTLVDDERLLKDINQLLADKKKGFETEYAPRVDSISEFVNAELERLEAKTQQIEKNDMDFEAINRFFLSMFD